MGEEFKIIEEEMQQLRVLKQMQKTYANDSDSENTEVYWSIDKMIEDVLDSVRELKFDEMIKNDPYLIELDKKHSEAFSESEKLYEAISEYPDFILGNVDPLPDDVFEILKSDKQYQQIKQDKQLADEQGEEMCKHIDKYADKVIDEFVGKALEYVVIKERIK